ncbi:hypothetical protein [Streptomyces sp. NPDC002537]
MSQPPEAEYERFVTEALHHIDEAGALTAEQYLQVAQIKATLALAAATLVANSTAAPVQLTPTPYDLLRDRIKADGGRWDSKRAQAACETLGIRALTPTSARQYLTTIAKSNPNLLVPVEGKSFTYEVVGT